MTAGNVGREPRQRSHHIPRVHRSHEAVEVSQARAQRWIASAIDSWEDDGRLTTDEATRLRAKIAEPQFVAVLPHFGAHLTIGAVLRFPFGSIVRVSYVLMNLLVATLRLLVRDIDRRSWRQATRIHSPVVLLIAGMPGIGTFAYLAARPMRSSPVILRLGIDAALMKFPKRIYQRTGLRWIIARPKAIATDDLEGDRRSLKLVVWAQSIILIQALIIGGLFVADLVSKVIAEMGLIDPHTIGIQQLLRILDLGAETSLGTWYEVTVLVFLSLLLAVVALARWQRREPYTRHWFVLSLLALGFSIDEQAKIHDAGGGTEVLREDLGLSGPIFYGWVIVGMLSVVTVALLYRRFIADLPQTTRRLYILAAGLFVTGEIVIESLGGWYADASGGNVDLIYHILTSFEEFIGMAGIFVAIAATLHYIQAHFGEVTISLGGGSPEDVRREASGMGASHE